MNMKNLKYYLDQKKTDRSKVDFLLYQYSRNRKIINGHNLVLMVSEEAYKMYFKELKSFVYSYQKEDLCDSYINRYHEIKQYQESLKQKGVKF